MSKLKKGYTTGVHASFAFKSALDNFIATNKLTISKTNKIDNDDLDVTKGCEIVITLSMKENDLILNNIKHKPYIMKKNDFLLKIYSGLGVGVVTKEGLKPPVGYSAINPVPLQNIENIFYSYINKYLIKQKNREKIIENKELKIAISVRSQSSSIRDNFTNNVNSLQGEVVSLKNLYPDINTGVVYLLKRHDIDDDYDCLPYYEENIPKKLLPIISGQGALSKDRFDTGCIIIWDIDKKGKVYFEKKSWITSIFSIKNFLNEIKGLYGEAQLKSQFTVADLEKKFISFLKAN